MTQVILLHGLGRSDGSMRSVARKLEAAGHITQSIDYPSTSGTIGDLVAYLAPKLPGRGKLHFVGHSLGGVLSKHLMRGLPDARQGCIVQMGAPNAGSELADRVRVLMPIMGPALEELEPGPIPDDNDLIIGAIAGTAALKSYGIITGIEGENDGKVSVRSAWGSAPEGRRIKLPVAHSTMMHNRDVLSATVHFLERASFTDWAPAEA